jgi:hypothetical protein
VVSFFTVSITVVLVESTTFVVSVVLVAFFPLQAAKDNAITTIKPSLIVFFIVLNELINKCLKIGR